MKRFTIIISSCLCALALAACGSSGLHFSGTAATTTSASAGVTTTPTRAARPTGGGRNPIAGAKAFTTALGARQFRAACDDLSTEARQEMVAFSKASRCPAALSGLFNFPGATAALQALKVVKPVTVQTGGDQAIVRLPFNSTKSWLMTLALQDGRWFVAGLNTKGTPTKAQLAEEAAANKKGPGAQATIGPNTPLLPDPNAAPPGASPPGAVGQPGVGQPSVGGTGGTLLPSTGTPSANTTLP